KDSEGKMLRVSVPSDVHYYAGDEERLHKKGEYKGINAGQGYDSTKQTVVQLHRWLGTYELTRGKSTDFYAVGDWGIAERRFVYRGESLNQQAPTYVPIGAPEQSGFILAGNAPARGREKRPISQVHFVDAAKAPMLVDFEGGTLTYHRRAVAAPKNEDGTTAE